MYKDVLRFQVCFDLIEKQIACLSNFKYILSQNVTVLEVAFGSEILPIGVYRVTLSSKLSKNDDKFVSFEIKEAVEFDYFPKVIFQDDIKDKVRIRFNQKSDATHCKMDNENGEMTVI